MLGQAIGQELLLLALGTDKHGDEQPNPRTIHVGEVAEVEDDGSGTVLYSGENLPEPF